MRHCACSDGVDDRWDQCPEEPENYNDFADTDGCPDKIGISIPVDASMIDTDDDAIPDGVQGGEARVILLEDEEPAYETQQHAQSHASPKPVCPLCVGQLRAAAGYLRNAR